MTKPQVTSKTMTIDAATKLCGVIGNPVAHSLSPHLHNAAFRSKGLNYVYLAFRVEDVGGCLAGMRAMPSFRGLSVTIPHKLAVMEHLDAIDPMAEHVGSVNTITNDDGRLVGSTTDGPGTLRAFEEAGVSFEGKRVLFVGTGGAVRAVAFAVAEQTPAAGITVLGRTDNRVATLIEDLRTKAQVDAQGGRLGDALEKAMKTHDIVVQGTPVGMHPKDDESLIPAEWLRGDQVIFDMVYRPEETRLAKDAAAAGCTVISGLEMLIHQAALQFEQWTGTPCPVKAMRHAARKVLAAE